MFIISDRSHRDLSGSKMRFLVISALIACAAAAPSGVLAPVAIPAVAFPATIPTLSPGDLQAAAIDAQVKAEDQARAAVDAQVKAEDEARQAADRARELTEQATESLNEKVTESEDLVKEKAVEQFWSVEDKKWQALDAIKTAEAQIDGSIASSANILAKSAVIAPFAAVAPVVPFPVAPVAPVIFPGIPTLKTEEKVEEKKEEAVKSADPEEKNDSVAIEAAPEALVKSVGEVKSEVVVTPVAEQPVAQPAAEFTAETALQSAQAKLEEAKSLLATVYAAPIPIAQAYRFPLVTPYAVSPILNYGTIPHVGLAPVLAKTW